MPPGTQTAIVQSEASSSTSLPLTVSNTAPVPSLPSRFHVLVRVLAVALNPNDHKMITHFPMPGNIAGCDFCGVIETVAAESGAALAFPMGTRVCGALFPYRPNDKHNGSFAQYVAADSRLLLKVPSYWSDLQAAALGGVGWSTLCLAFSDPEALSLQGTPSKPVEKKVPILVYGGATATGTLACQLLALSGYTPIAVTSAASEALAVEYGAAGTAQYTSPTCSETIRSLVKEPIRHALDCITDAESAAICFRAISRGGGRYACLEGFPEAWRTRRAIKVKEVMGFEILGVDVHLGDTTYTRSASEELFNIGKHWASEMQSLLNAGLVKTHPIREVQGQWEGIINGVAALQRGEVRAEKLVVRLSAS
ncbi:hypothetical protein DL765_003918 [Monosporascus sp. GIB2]|nr:hypothetical protein DL765_003918 [Monosporascus sp. GIB2]